MATQVPAHSRSNVAGDMLARSGVPFGPERGLTLLGLVMRRSAAFPLVLAFGLSACLPSKQDVDTAQALIQIEDAINDIRQEQSSLHDSIDSLRLEVVKRDTVIKQLANLAGVQIPP